MRKKILTPLQEIFLNDFFESFSNVFFLSGGTALAAFYLHHRLSEDIDLFTLDQNLDFAMVNAEVIKIATRRELRIEHHVQTPSIIRYIFKQQEEPLKVDVVKDVPVHFGKVRKFGNAWVDSLENIAVGKLLAAFGRADGKDFVDLYFLFKQSSTEFETVFQHAKKKDLGLTEFYLAHMLARVQELESFPKTLKPFDQEDLVQFFLGLSQRLFKKIQPKA